MTVGFARGSDKKKRVKGSLTFIARNSKPDSGNIQESNISIQLASYRVACTRKNATLIDRDFKN